MPFGDPRRGQMGQNRWNFFLRLGVSMEIAGKINGNLLPWELMRLCNPGNMCTNKGSVQDLVLHKWLAAEHSINPLPHVAEVRPKRLRAQILTSWLLFV